MSGRLPPVGPPPEGRTAPGPPPSGGGASAVPRHKVAANRLQRFTIVGLVVTAVDVLLLSWLVLGRGARPFEADLFSVAVATLCSYVLHPLVTMAGHPMRRWFEDHLGSYVSANIGSFCTDVVVFTVLTDLWGSGSILPVLAAKSVALGAAVLVRLAAYRSLLRHAIRADQRFPHPVVRVPGGPVLPRLSVVIPAYREGDRIADTVRRVRNDLAALQGADQLEIVVVDDGSDDDTAAMARSAEADQVVRLATNSGKGAAVRAGMVTATGEVRAFLDADLAYSPAQLLGLLEKAEEGWDVVVGSRKHTAATTLVRTGRLRELGSRVINLLTSVVLLGQYRDTQCGIKAFRAGAAQRVFGVARIDRFAADIEMLYLVERFRLTLVEVPVAVSNSERSTVRVVTDTVRLLRDLVRIRVLARAGAYEPGSREGFPAAR